MLVKKLEEINAICDRIEGEHFRPPTERPPEVENDKYRELIAVAREMTALPSIVYELEDDSLPEGKLASIRDRLTAPAR